MIGLYPNEPRVRWDHTDLNDLLLWGSHSGMSDLNLRSGDRAWMRVYGVWRAVTERPITADELLSGLERMTRNNSIAALLKSGQKDYDFAHQIDEMRHLRRRYRGNATPVADGYSTGVKIVFRTVASEPPPTSSLNLEQPILDYAFPENGLVLITGVMGSGKSTLLAAILRDIIEKGGRNVATYEAPIEFDFSTIKSPGGPVSQCSIPDHLADFLSATRNSTRTAPDVVLIGESRDPETLRGMIESAEIGVAAYSTVHSRSVPDTIPRILRFFPREEHAQVAATLITSLRLIVSQRLLPHPSGEGRTALREFLPFTAEMRETLLETPVERLNPVMERLLEAHGQKLQIPAKAAFDEGKISREHFLGIVAERKHKSRSYGEQPSEQEAMAWPTYPMMSYGAVPVWFPKQTFWMPAPGFLSLSGAAVHGEPR
jgi:defect-in-organelle-trafficking protein DotB